MAQSSKLNTEFTADTSPLLAGLAQAKAAVKEFNEGINKVSESIKYLVAGAGLGEIVHIFKEAYENIDKLVASASKLNIGVGNLQELQFAAKMTNTDIGALEDGLGKLRKRIGEAQQSGGDAAKAFTQLGLNANTLASKNLKDAYLDVSDAIKQVRSSQDQATASIDIFGRAGQEQLKLLRSDIRGFVEEAKKLGIPLTEHDVEQFEELDKKAKVLSATISADLNKAFIALAPTIQGITEDLQIFVEASAKAATQISKIYAEKSAKVAITSDNPTGLGIFNNPGRPIGAPGSGLLPNSPVAGFSATNIVNSFLGLDGAIKNAVINVNELGKSAKQTGDVFAQNRFKDLFGLNAPDGKSSLQSILSKPTQYVNPAFADLANEVRDLIESGVKPNDASVQSKIRSANAIASQGVPIYAADQTGLPEDTKFSAAAMQAAAKAMLDLANNVKTAPMATINIKTDSAVKAYLETSDGRLKIVGMIENATSQEAASTSGAL